MITIGAIIYFTFLVLELFTLAFGLSIMFQEANAVQMVMHGLGVLFNIWMILDRWHWIQLYVLAFFFALIPFVIEISVVIQARLHMK